MEDAPVRVLSIDDDNVNQMVVGRSLRRGNYVVTQASSSEEAFDILADLHSVSGFDDFPHIILMDLNMPGISGIEACKKLKDLYPQAPCQVVFITGDSSQDTADRVKKVSCHCPLIKPIKPDNLRKKLQDVAAGHFQVAVGV